MIALGLGGVALSFVGVNGREERQQVGRRDRAARGQWPAEWLRMRGLPDGPAYLEQKYTDKEGAMNRRRLLGELRERCVAAENSGRPALSAGLRRSGRSSPTTFNS